MKCARHLSLAAWLISAAMPLPALAAGGERAGGVIYFAGSEPSNSAAVAVYDESLLHTEQLTAAEEDIRQANGDIEAETDAVLDALNRLLGDPNVNRRSKEKVERKNWLTDIAKLNVYVSSDGDAAGVRRAVARRFSGYQKPALSLVTTSLPVSGAHVALDAVAANADCALAVDSRGAVLPRGPRAYISGDAKPGGSLAEATTATLLSLDSTLRFLGIGREHVVQLKAFLQPMDKAAEVREAVAAFFKPQPIPPLILVEWTSTLPIEIELIAAVPPGAAPGPTLRFATPPGMKASPVFSRVAIAEATTQVYFSGLHGLAGASADDQVRGIFSQLQPLLKKTGGDMQNLVKATYYVTDPGATAALGKLRPEYYDPTRPPAASLAAVRGLALPRGCSLSMDMIAVSERTD